ncbi:MAG: hypothetical protein AAFR65_11150 [Pseudomonadota bacterium]
MQTARQTPLVAEPVIINDIVFQTADAWFEEQGEFQDADYLLTEHGYCHLDDTFICDSCGERHTNDQLNRGDEHLCDACFGQQPYEVAAAYADDIGAF